MRLGPSMTIVRDTTCITYVDDTASVDPVGRERAVQSLADGLPGLLDVFACRELRIGRFGDEGAFAPVKELLVPVPPIVACADFTPNADVGCEERRGVP
jgi:hypothetical protein